LRARVAAAAHGVAAAVVAMCERRKPLVRRVSSVSEPLCREHSQQVMSTTHWLTLLTSVF
jgi:hypothetical protein